jgi:hypothetical protein
VLTLLCACVPDERRNPLLEQGKSDCEKAGGWCGGTWVWCPTGLAPNSGISCGPFLSSPTCCMPKAESGSTDSQDASADAPDSDDEQDADIDASADSAFE